MPARDPTARLRSAAVLAAALLLAACATRPPRDGAEANPPAGLERVPDADPRVEPIRAGGPNKPYSVDGTSYVPFTSDRALKETGLASWYGRKFQGRPTASGEPYDMYAMTAAHKTMPIPSYARVKNPANGREVIVRVNDRGPFASGRVIDLSYTAALRLGVLGGVAPVQVERITHEEIRAGLWRRDRTLPEPPPPAANDDALLAWAAAAEATPPQAPPAPGWWLQLGAFRQREGAEALVQRVQREAEGLVPAVSLSDGQPLYRVHAGPYPTRSEALAAVDRLRALLSLVPLLVERR